MYTCKLSHRSEVVHFSLLIIRKTRPFFSQHILQHIGSDDDFTNQERDSVENSCNSYETEPKWVELKFKNILVKKDSGSQHPDFKTFRLQKIAHEQKRRAKVK